MTSGDISIKLLILKKNYHRIKRRIMLKIYNTAMQRELALWQHIKTRERLCGHGTEFW
jgi:hypothetical protein